MRCVLSSVAAALLLLLAGCQALPWSTAAGPPVTAPAVLPESSAMASGGTRALALVPPNHAVEGAAGRPIIVRGNQPAAPPAAAAAAAPAAAGGGDVSLNFAGADIRDVIASVLGETLKLNYVIDPEVTGPVTFNVSRPIPRSEVLATLEAVLNSRGATMIRSDGIIRVMPLRKAGKPDAPLPIGRTAIGARTEVFPLRYVDATDMEHLLQKVLPPGQVVIGDAVHHLVLVQGTVDELQVAENTIRIFDIDQLSGMSMALIPLHNAEPAAVASELKNIFAASSGKDPGSAVVRIMAIDRLNAVMVLTRSPRYLDEARQWIDRLDRAQDVNARKVYVYNLQYSKAVPVARQLQGLLSGLNIQFQEPGTPAGDGLGGTAAATRPSSSPLTGSPLSPAAAPAAAPQPLPPAPPPPLPAATPEAAAAAEQSGVRIEADPAHNALLISANVRDYNLIRQVLDGIDVPPLQVLIEVTVAEVTLNNQLNYGVQYFINSHKVLGLLTTGMSATGITPTVPGAALSWVSGTLAPKVILDALSELTQTKVISTPRLLVLSNQQARLQVGDVVPIITQSATSTETSNPLIVNNVQYKETGVVLEVTPRVNAGGYVTLDINQSVSNVINTTTSTINSPTIQQRQLTSTVSVKSGQTIMLGGLIQQSDNRDSSGVPFLHEIPGIGTLFGNKNDSAQRTELIMFMTPHVISNEHDANDITQTVRREFQAVLDSSDMAPVRRPQR